MKLSTEHEKLIKKYSDTVLNYFKHANKRGRTKNDEEEAAWAIKDMQELEEELWDGDTPKV